MIDAASDKLHHSVLVAEMDAARAYAGEFGEQRLEALVRRVIEATDRARARLAEDRITGMAP